MKFLDNSLPVPPPNMPPLQPIEPSLPTPTSGNWYLLSVRPKKRELFTKYLNIALTKSNLKEVILDIKIPQDSVYEDIVLLNLSNFQTANSQLQKIEHFQNLQRKPLALEQVNRMIGNQ